jgi:hypothetical protein
MPDLEDFDRFERAIAAIDAANGEDPNRLPHAGESIPKELLHAELVSRRIEQLVDEPSEALRLAARAHHLKRWKRPRSDYPEGRASYHRWRRDLQLYHADEAAKILTRVGYDAPMAERVGDLICKRGLASDPEAQALEDALCLVFVEMQLVDFAEQHPDAKVVDILVQSLRKMSPAGHAAAREISLPAKAATLLERAVSAL